eukprot:457324_1
MPTMAFYHEWLLYIGVIGSFLSLLQIIILSLHTAYHIQTKKSDQSPCAYIILFACFSTMFITILFHLTLNTNLFLPSMTYLQCRFGYLLFYIFGSLSMTSLYIMLLYRIKATFQGSVFEYKPYVFRIFYCFIFTDSLLFITDKIFRALEINQFEILHTTRYPLSLCHTNAKTDTINRRYTLIFSSTMHVFLVLSFLYMFVKRLRSLNQGMIQNFMKEHCKPQHINDKSSTVDLVIAQYQNSVKTKQKRMSQSVIRIMELNDMIKKQSILVIIIIVGTLMFWSLIALDAFYTYLFAINFAINSICVWLMNGVSTKYWMCCRSYGLCRCCYTKISELHTNTQQKDKEMENDKPYVQSPGLKGMNIDTDSLHIIRVNTLNLNDGMMTIDTQNTAHRITPAPSRRPSVLHMTVDEMNDVNATPIVDIMEMDSGNEESMDDVLVLEELWEDEDDQEESYNYSSIRL